MVFQGLGRSMAGNDQRGIYNSVRAAWRVPMKLQDKTSIVQTGGMEQRQYFVKVTWTSLGIESEVIS